METVYKTTKNCLKFAEVDIYKEGCQPETGQSYVCDISFQAKNPKQIIEEIKDFFKVESDSLLLNSCDEIGRIDVQLLENTEGIKASKYEIEDWKKKGCVDLWACTYSFIVEKHLIERVDLINI